MKNNIGFRIRKLRESKDYNQQNMADELELSLSAYSKIERGVTDPSIGRLEEIARILDVNITYFFDKENAPTSEDGSKSYGFATKGDIEELHNIIKQLRQEIIMLKKEKTEKEVKPPSKPKKK